MNDGTPRAHDDLPQPRAPLTRRLAVAYNVAVRAISLWAASLFLRGVDAEIVARSAFAGATQRLAALAEYVEKSGHVRHRTHAYHRLRAGIDEVAELLVTGAHLGGARRGRQVAAGYAVARLQLMSRRQRRRPEIQAGIKTLVNQGVLSPALLETR